VNIMKKLISVFTVLAVVSCGGFLLADPVTLTWNGVNPGIGNAGVNNLVIDGVPTLGYCVDPGSISPGTYDNYYLIPVPTTGALAPNYLLAATIFDQQGTPAGDQAAANVQNAIWYAMGMSSTYLSNTDVQAIVLAAQGAPLASLVGYALVVSPDPDEFFDIDHQDFIIRTPEPASILLLGLGLFGVGLVGKRFR